MDAPQRTRPASSPLGTACRQETLWAPISLAGAAMQPRDDGATAGSIEQVAVVRMGARRRSCREETRERAGSHAAEILLSTCSMRLRRYAPVHVVPQPTELG